MSVILNHRAFRRGVGLLFPVLVFGLLGARCSASHDDGNTRIEVVVVHTQNASSLPTGDVLLHEPITIVFSDVLDPESVTPETVQIRRVDNGEPALGVLRVEEDSVVFIPRLGGLDPGARYRVLVPGRSAPGGSVRSLDGSPLRRRFAVKFETARIE